MFRKTLSGNFQGLAAEQIFASPLVYTGNDGIQYVYVATTQNDLYKLDAKTGAIVANRTLHAPLLQVELESRSILDLYRKYRELIRLKVVLILTPSLALRPQV